MGLICGRVDVRGRQHGKAERYIILPAEQLLCCCAGVHKHEISLYGNGRLSSRRPPSNIDPHSSERKSLAIDSRVLAWRGGIENRKGDEKTDTALIPREAIHAAPMSTYDSY